MIKPVHLIFALLTCSPFFLGAQDTLLSDTIVQPVVFVGDDPVAAMLDSLTTLTIFKGNGFDRNHSGKPVDAGANPDFPDSVYRLRIMAMNEQSPFEYIYNSQVRQFIDLYAVKKRELTSRILGLSELYFPLFEEQLDRYNLPLELKYLAVIESALNPTANSRAGAKGLWQFMYGTGKVYGLKVTSLVDDRFDPVKSTVAACEHLRDLYDIYGNWSLALAAYNSGAGNVNKAIRRSGGHKNFWTIYPYLPRETRSYVPAFIAASYVMIYASDHRIIPVEPEILHYEIDTVAIKDILTFDQISAMLNISKDELAFLNPSFKQGIIPATAGNPYYLRLRQKDAGTFVTNEANLYAYKAQQARERDSLAKIVEESMKATQYYVVRSGDNLGSIAGRYGMSVTQLKKLNNLSSNTIYPRQKLLVLNSHASRSSGGYTSASVPSAPAVAPVSDPEPAYHVVRQGETLGIIAGKYGCTVNQIMSWNNLTKSTIYSGQKLKVKGTASSPVASSNGSDYFYYTIKTGDNLWDLAQKYDCTVSTIKNLNRITNANRLKPGQKIKIPK
jgi:membrane-bound lytic murein transglycosylase D